MKRVGQSLSSLFNGGQVDPSYAEPGPVHSSFDDEGHLLSLQELQPSPYCPSPTTSTPPSPITVRSGFSSSNLYFKPNQHVSKTDSEFVSSSEPLLTEEAKSEALVKVFDEILNDEFQSVVSMNLREAKAVESVANDLIEEVTGSCAIQVVFFLYCSYHSIYHFFIQIAKEEVTVGLDCVSSVAEDISEFIIASSLSDSLHEIVYLAVFEKAAFVSLVIR